MYRHFLKIGWAAKSPGLISDHDWSFLLWAGAAAEDGAAGAVSNCPYKLIGAGVAGLAGVAGALNNYTHLSSQCDVMWWVDWYPENRNAYIFVAVSWHDFDTYSIILRYYTMIVNCIYCCTIYSQQRNKNINHNVLFLFTTVVPYAL